MSEKRRFDYKIGDTLRLGKTIEIQVLDVKDGGLLTRGRKGRIRRILNNPFDDSIVSITPRGRDSRLQIFNEIKLIDPLTGKVRK